MEKKPLYGRGLWDIRIWIGLGLVFVFLNSFNDSGPKSPFWFAELILYALMIAGLWANQKHDLRKKIRIPRRLAPVAYICLNWFFGMVYETGLTVNGRGIGGLHPQTYASFIIAQGDYITIAVVSYILIRWMRLSFREMFFVAGGKSLTEGLIFTGVLTALIVSPMFFLSPILLGYYTLAYSSFIALPLLFIDEELLWKKGEPGKQHSTIIFWILGFVLAMPIRIFWGLVYSPIVADLFNLPPNVGGG